MAYTTEDIGGFYKQYLGRDLQNEGEAQGWLDNPNAEAMIKGSGEAAEFRKRGVAGTPWSGEASAPQSGTQLAGSAPMTGGTAPSFGGDYQAYFNQLFPGGNITPAELQAKSADLARVGITIHKSTSGDNIRLPDGRLVDVIQDAGPTTASKNIKAWQVEGSGGGGGGSASYSGGGGGGGQALGLSPAQSAQRDALYQELMDRSKQGLNIDAQNDANIRQQADPYEAAMIRAERERMANVAEGRGPLANIEGERRLGAEKVGQASGAFEAGLIGDEIAARRAEIESALRQRSGMLSQDQQESLQRELANLDDQLKRYQISQQAGQFSAGLGLDRQRLQSSEDQFMAELASRNQQWEDQLDLRNRNIYG